MTDALPTPDLDLFISHASADDAAVSQIDAALNAAGISTWVDHEHGIDYGDRWQEAIDSATLRCRAALYILTPDSARSVWCNRELTRIQEQLGRTVYVALVKPLPAWKIPMLVNNVYYADLSSARLDDPADATLAGLAAAIQGKRSFDRILTSEQRTRRVSGQYPHTDLLYTLYGRDTDLNEVKSALVSSERGTPIVMLLGLGGVGKTRLAVEIVDQMDFHDGAIWFAFDSQLSDEANATARVAELIRAHFGMPASPDEDAAWAALNARETLLVLDNAEDCPPNLRAAYARRLKGLREGARVLITSRHAWEELDARRDHDLRAPSSEDGVKILTRMAEIRDYAAKLNGQAAALAKAARYHPRLMLYAVGWLKANSPGDIIEQLEPLEGKLIEKALEEVVGKTLKRMSEQEGEDVLSVLRRLNVTRNGFTREAAKALLSSYDVMHSLTTLAAWNLLEYDGARYNIDPLVARTAGEDETVHEAHCNYYLKLAIQQDELQDYAVLDPESANLEHAFRWVVEQGDAIRVVELAQYGGAFLLNQGRVYEKHDWAKQAEALTNEMTSASLWAVAQNNLGNSFTDLSKVEARSENLRRAIDAYESALVYNTSSTDALKYAMIQNNLGTVYSHLSEVEEREKNLHRAIAAFHKALVYQTVTSTPRDYAMTQNNLGNAYRTLSEIHDHEGNLHHAIKSYKTALNIPKLSERTYAMIQNNLGIAYVELSAIKNREENINHSIACFESALMYYTRTTAPFSFAATQNNLGIAYIELSAVKDRKVHLYHAIEVLEIALVFRTPTLSPLDYAATQDNLGSAYNDLSSVEDRQGNLLRAISAYRNALAYRTPIDAPLDYARTQNNIGTVYRELSTLENRKENLNNAIIAYQYALVYRTLSTSARAYAKTQINLGDTYRDLSAIEDHEDNLLRAITAYEAALIYATPAVDIVIYSIIQTKFGFALWDLGDQAGACAAWVEGEKYARLMGHIERADAIAAHMRENGCV